MHQQGAASVDTAGPTRGTVTEGDVATRKHIARSEAGCKGRKAFPLEGLQGVDQGRHDPRQYGGCVGLGPQLAQAGWDDVHAWPGTHGAILMPMPITA